MMKQHLGEVPGYNLLIVQSPVTSDLTGSFCQEHYEPSNHFQRAAE